MQRWHPQVDRKKKKEERMKFLSALAKDIVEQSWTLLGMVVAWLVLEGSAKELVGNLILVTLALWVVTFPFFRYEKEESAPAKKK